MTGKQYTIHAQCTPHGGGWLLLLHCPTTCPTPSSHRTPQHTPQAHDPSPPPLLPDPRHDPSPPPLLPDPHHDLSPPPLLPDWSLLKASDISLLLKCTTLLLTALPIEMSKTPGSGRPSLTRRLRWCWQ